MRHSLVMILALAGIAIVGTLTNFTAKTDAQTPPLRPTNAAPAPFDPGMGDLMNLLVQPRHLKLGLAGSAENWPLAEYEIKELRAALASVTRSRPQFRGQQVEQLFDAVMRTPLQTVGDAIRDRNSTNFANSYAAITDACNSCHAALSHPFVVIKVPTQQSFPNQEFGAAK